jgi:hypothetical protein
VAAEQVGPRGPLFAAAGLEGGKDHVPVRLGRLHDRGHGRRHGSPGRVLAPARRGNQQDRQA